MFKLYLAIIVILLIVIAAGAYLYWQKDSPAASKVSIKNSEMLAKDGKYQISERPVDYFAGMNGFLAEPASPGSYPGVVMIHEWWGLNDNIRDMARELAKEGYVVLAVDLFSKVAATAEEARAQTAALDQEKALKNLRAAAAYLRGKGAAKIASLGWCFGGGQSLRVALSGEKLDATVIYYGQLITDGQELKKISWPVLGIFGDQDTSIPVATVNEFGAALNNLGVQNSIHIYPNVGHAFANPSGMNYAAEATKDAWAKTVLFLETNLKETRN